MAQWKAKMNNDLILICYDGDSGSSDIRTFYQGTILYVALRDIYKTLNKENRKLNDKHIAKTMVGIIEAELESLDSDEYLMVPVADGSYTEKDEAFVTQAGLYRVLSGDRSETGKRFQRWLFHEVIPAIFKYGEYPAP